MIGRRLLARGDQLGSGLVDLLVQRIVEVVRLEEARDAVVRLVVDEDGAEQRLLGLEVVGRGAEGQGLGRGGLVRRLGGLAACGFGHGRAIADSASGAARVPGCQAQPRFHFATRMRAEIAWPRANSACGGQRGYSPAMRGRASILLVLEQPVLVVEHVVAGQRQGLDALGELQLEHDEV